MPMSLYQPPYPSTEALTYMTEHGDQLSQGQVQCFMHNCSSSEFVWTALKALRMQNIIVAPQGGCAGIRDMKATIQDMIDSNYYTPLETSNQPDPSKNYSTSSILAPQNVPHVEAKKCVISPAKYRDFDPTTWETVVRSGAITGASSLYLQGAPCLHRKEKYAQVCCTHAWKVAEVPQLKDDGFFNGGPTTVTESLF
ncbi:hypothetical protein C8R43DRAFT_944792 [Mycena crocata]|nr:hypothetical protein C8R43DRAFT_944792 [Mycena crocata]